MKAVLFLLLVWFSAASNAQTAVVRSGEHEGFTRLVVSWPNSEPWRLYRTPEGYDLVVHGEGVQFDLTEAFRRISNQRIADLIAKDDTLHLVLSCECFAAPFALQKGVLVLDIKDGTAPTGSVFELDQDGRSIRNRTSRHVAPHQIATSADTSRPHLPFEAIGAIAQASRLSPSMTVPNALIAEPSLAGVRKELLMQLSKGAAAGVVETVVKMPDATKPNKGTALNSNMRIQREMGVVAGTQRPNQDEMTAAGYDCIPSEHLNVGDWADPTIVVSEFADNTTDLVGEFDHPEVGAIDRAMRYYLALGFGAEARQLASAFKASPAERAMLATLSFIVDLEPPPGSAFAGMENCDTNAAMWAVLEKQELKQLGHIAIPAVLRAFSALPIHLRRLLGPGLAERFLAAEDYSTAASIRDAINRTAQEQDPAQTMLDARLQLTNGDIASAENQLSQLAGTSNPTGITATITLIQTQVESGQEVSPNLTTTAEAQLQEAQGGTSEANLREALALAYASQNRFREAFEQVDRYDLKAKKIWDILGSHGSDDAVLTMATLETREDRPDVAAETGQKIARHLLDLGFPDKAVLWLGPSSEQDETGLILAARAQLMLNNDLEVLNLLENLKSPDSDKLRARALAKLRTGDAVDQLIQSGQENEAEISARQKRDWPKLMQFDKSGIWREAAALTNTFQDVTEEQASGQAVKEGSIDTKGPLARTRDTLKESEAARAVLNQLLASQSLVEFTTQ
jgi:hypothetical protein